MFRLTLATICQRCNKNRKTVAVLIVILLLALVFFTQLPSKDKIATHSTLTKVTRGDITHYVFTTGTLNPKQLVKVGAQVNGQLRRLFVKVGDTVKKGQLLAEIDPVLQQNELKRMLADLSRSKAELVLSTILLDQYQKTLHRQQKMYNDGSGVQSDLESAKAQYDSQKQTVKINQAQIIQSEMAVETAKANVSYTRITSPIDGIVLGIATQEGQTIVSSQIAPTIMVIADTSVMHVKTRISEVDILKVKPGQPVLFRVVSAPNQVFQSVMGLVQSAPDSILNSSDSEGGSDNASSAVYYNAFFELSNNENILKSAMTAEVSIIISEAKGVLRIPIAALWKPLAENKYTVNTVSANGLAPMEKVIQIGIRDSKYVEVKEGLNEGDVVVLGNGEHE